MAELELIAAIERALRARGGRVVRGPGDDAAVVVVGGGVAVTSIDSMVEDVHFKLSTHSPADVGHKALATALSDLAAMGARSGEAYVALGLPTRLGERAAAASSWRPWRRWPTARAPPSPAGTSFLPRQLLVSVTVTGWANGESELVYRDGAGLATASA